jgi:hypothetical protein
MTWVLWVVAAIGVLIFLLILVVTSLPSPMITRLVKRYLRRG